MDHARRFTLTVEISESDLAILQMLANGLQNKEVAAKIGRANRTVKYHITRICRRFGYATRVELIAFAFRNHLVK